MGAPERRRVQRTGGSTLIVSLPKPWARSVGLDAGDFVLIVPQLDGSLLIMPEKRERKGPVAEVEASARDEVEDILRDVIARFLLGYDTIKVVFKGETAGERRILLKNLVRQKLPGIEIMEETFDSLTLKVLLNVEEIPLERALRRLFVMAQSMVRDALRALRELNEALASDVILRDDEVDRFHFMILRYLSLALIDRRLMMKIGIKHAAQIPLYQSVAKSLERIADHGANISERALTLRKLGYRPDRLAQEISELGERSLRLVSIAMNAFLSASRKLANEVIHESKNMDRELADLISRLAANKLEPAVASHLMLVLESIRRIYRYSADIAEDAVAMSALAA